MNKTKSQTEGKKDYDLKRYLVEVKVYMSDQNETLLLETMTVESDSGNILYLPSIKLFKEDAKLNITTSILEERFYKNAGCGMVTMVKSLKIK